MVSRDSSKLKVERLAEIRRVMQQSISKGVEVERLLDYIELNIGLRRSTAAEYVALVTRAEGWLKVDDRIVNKLR